MRVVRPSWVIHADEKDRKSTMYSLDVHPDGTRLATGGIDRKVKIWNTVPIIDEEAASNEDNHKLLCTMSSHTGSVLCVRWAHHGRYLASGSDDFVIMLWGIDTEGGGRVFGSNEVNVESWRPLKRLVGHTADVIDLAWSRDDSMLASVGLDNSVLIWDGHTFDKIRKIDQHTDFVKGVCWDPVGQFLATQSDDKTVKIWNTEDWSLVKSVEKPFQNSPKSTFFRRLSWSPDGAFIAASNAMNGPVFVASVIERGEAKDERSDQWNAEISFVGHESTIQVAAFNPRLFFDAAHGTSRATASCMLALGADDFSVSIWRNTMHKPFVVVKDLFTNALHDMCWANDGHHLYCCSHDGTIAAFIFEPTELPDIGEMEQTEQVIREYDYKGTKRVPARIAPLRPAPSASEGFGAPSAPAGAVNVLQPRKKRPGPPRLVPGASGTPSQTSNNPFETAIQADSNSAAQRSRMAMMNGAQNAFGTNAEAGPSARVGQKRKNSDVGYGSDRLVFSGAARLPDNIQQIRAPRQAIIANGAASSGRRLPLPVIQTILRETTPFDGYVEAHNSEGTGRSKVVYTSGVDEGWEDHVPSKILNLSMSGNTCAVGLEDGKLLLYSRAGDRSNTKTKEKIVDERSISRLLEADGKSVNLVRFDVASNGIPIIITSEPAAYAFDTAYNDWREIFTADIALSPAAALTGDRLVASLEKEIRALSPSTRHSERDHGPPDALLLHHLRARVQAAQVLASRSEIEGFAEEYAKALDERQMTDRAIELCDELHAAKETNALGSVVERFEVGVNMRDLARVFRRWL